MAYSSLHAFVQALEEAGELVRIHEYVNPHLEIADITDRVSKSNGPALLFENTGTEFPLLINALGSYRRMCLALGVENLDDIAREVESLFQVFMKPGSQIMDQLRMLPRLGRIASWMPRKRKGRGACQQVVMDPPDLTRFPVMTCWPQDGGPFITLPVIHTQDPETGTRNVGMYRMQVFGPDLTGMHWHKHKVSAGHFRKFQQLGKKMPVAVALGGDPVLAYSATAPLPPNVDEYILAGFIRKKRVELVKCLTQDIWVPAEADIIIEGYVDPEEELILEGPFGDHTGYYSLADYYPRFHVTAVTHRREAIYPSTIVGIPPQEDAWIGKATERIFLAPIRMTLLPELSDMDMPVEGVFHNLTITSLKKEYPGHAYKVKNAMWGAGQMMFNKILVAVDDGLNIHDYEALARHVSENVNPASDIIFGKGPMDVLDHSCSHFAFGGKMFIDATKKLPEEIRPGGAVNPDPREIRIDWDQVKKDFPAITGHNDSLLARGISVVAVAVEKSGPGFIRHLNERLFRLDGLRLVKWILYCEPVTDIGSLHDIIWRVTNNMDPGRDVFLVPSDGTGPSHAGIDGTRKTRKDDGFDRDWPNIICADMETMDSVDAKWPTLGLGPLIESPSRKYRQQIYPGGAMTDPV